MADEINNNKWVINARMLITRVNMLQHNKNDAKTEVCNALDVAKNKMHDADLIEYLTKVTLLFVYLLNFLSKAICF